MNRYIIFFTLFFSTLFAQSPININSSQIDSFNIGEYEDKNSSLSIEDIKNKKFIQVSNNISNGFTNSTFWYKIALKNATSGDIERYIKVTESILDKIDFYILSNNIIIKHKKDGVGYFQDGKINELKRAFIKFKLKKGETKTIYIKIYSFYPMFNSFKIYDKKTLDNFEYKYATIYAFLLGSLLSLALYNLMIYFYTKDANYVLYVLYSLSLIIWQTSMSGLFPFNKFLNTDSYYMIGASIPLLIAFLSLFTNSLLNIKSISKKYYYILNFIGLFYVCLAFWSIFDFKPAISTMNATASFVLPFLLYIAYKSYRSGNKIAVFYLYAQGSFLSMATLFSLSSYGFLQYNYFLRHGLIIGSFIEMILFSLALAYRVKVLEEEKISIIQKAKDDLELRVKERTKELEESKIKLEVLAKKDYLSDLYNRRPLFEISNKLISLAKRDNTHISILLFDIDKFKIINDTYGHTIGDKVIKTFASLLKKDRRSSDIVSRIGGEEFVILQPSTTIENAYKIAEEIRKETEKIEIKEKNTIIKFTVSCGIDTLKDDDKKIDEIIARADKKLYEAKNTGRNKVIA